MNDAEVLPFPPERKVVVDAGYLAARRHVTYGLLEVDVTDARERLRSLGSTGGGPVSFTAFIVVSLAQAVAQMPMVQAYRDWRGRLVAYRDVDVVTMIEAEKGAVAIPHIIRQANRRTVVEVSEELRQIRESPARSEQNGRLVRLAPKVPRPLRLLFFWVLKRNPAWFRQIQGTVVVTSVGMFGQGGGWGIGFLPSHTLGLTVGGIAQKPGVHGGDIRVREYLHLTIAFDHDIVDGAPAARFSRSLCETLEVAAVLELPSGVEPIGAREPGG